MHRPLGDQDISLTQSAGATTVSLLLTVIDWYSGCAKIPLCVRSTIQGFTVILGHQIETTIAQLGTTHVIWLPDTTLGEWEEAFESSTSFDLLRVCREGEAWPLAAGLYLGGKSPLVMMQTTGLFESGDALRNVLFDLKIPLFAIIGYRSYLVEDSPDTAKKYAEPILNAWGLKYELIDGPNDLAKLIDHYRVCQAAGTPGVALIAEGAM